MTRLRARRGWRFLPPVGGRIPARVVLGALADSLRTAVRRGGADDQRLQQEMAQRTGRAHWVLTNSGRSALSVVFMALRELRPSCDEVIIPAYTSYSVPAAVVRAGLKVRLCDVEMETLGLSPKELEPIMTPRTLCVVANYLYGVPCGVKRICEIADQHGVPVIEDAAQAMGISREGQLGGTWGKTSIFSLSRGKVIPASGGGLVGTNDEVLAHQCRRILSEWSSGSRKPRRLGLGSVLETVLMAVFIRPSLYRLPAWLPFLRLGASIYDPRFRIDLMSRFQEALAKRQLPGLDELQRTRERNAIRLGRALEELNGLWVLWPKEGETGGFLRLLVFLRDPAMRERVLVALQSEGLGASGGYPLPVSDIAELRPHVVGSVCAYPVASRISRHLVTLPTHPWVRERDIVRIVDVFRNYSH